MGERGTYHDGSLTSVGHMEITICQLGQPAGQTSLPELLKWIGAGDIGIQDKER
jgi:hypothetical protein